jgi:hypothetical protein
MTRVLRFYQALGVPVGTLLTGKLPRVTAGCTDQHAYEIDPARPGERCGRRPARRYFP